MLMPAAGWLTEVSLGKLIVLAISAVLIVPVMMVKLVAVIVGPFAVTAGRRKGPAPWEPPEPRGRPRTEGEATATRRPTGALT